MTTLQEPTPGPQYSPAKGIGTKDSGYTYQSSGWVADNPVISAPPKEVNPIVQTSDLAAKNKQDTANFLDWAKTNLTTQQSNVATQLAGESADKQTKAEADRLYQLELAKQKNEETKVNALTGGTGSAPTTTRTSYMGIDGKSYFNDTGEENIQGTKDKILTDYKTATDAMLNGTFPLNPLQQAQLDAMKQQFESLVTEQKEANAQYEGAMTQSGITGGRSRYAPEIEAGNILNAVNVGVQKVADLNGKMASSLAQMEAGFQSNNYSLIEKSYNVYKKAEDDKQAAIDEQQKLIAEALKETNKSKITSSRDAAIINIASQLQGNPDVATILDYLNYYEDGTPTGANYTSQEVQNTVSNVYKEPKEPKVVAGTVNSGTLTYSPKAAADDEAALENTRGEDGYVDPTTYQNLYKAWIQNGGLLKDFVAKFPPSLYVNPANTWLPPALRPKTTSGIDFGSL